MKITLEPYCGGTYTSESEAEHISIVINQFKGLLVAAGFHPHTVDDYFNEEAWFEEEDEEFSISKEDEDEEFEIKKIDN